jgi:hypothetical protein
MPRAEIHPVTAPSGEQIELAWGDQHAVVVEVGGGLRSYTLGGHELLDGYGLDEMCTSGRGQVHLTLGTATVDPLILSVPAQRVLTSNEHGIPIGTELVEGTAYDFRRPRPIAGTKLDNAFTDLERGADGLARVELPEPQRGARSPATRCPTSTAVASPSSR